MPSTQTKTTSKLVDSFGREVTYLRLSVTDRCDFRCIYCMAEDMQFLPRRDILSLEELALVAEAFVSLGVNKIRLTGGEPLVRSNLPWLVKQLHQLEGLKQLAMTSNGARLAQFAEELREGGLQAINISLDSLRPKRFRQISRTGELSDVLAGIEACKTAGFERIKINSVIMRGKNDDEILDLLNFALDNSVDISFIEEMPLGEVGYSRSNTVIDNSDIKSLLEKHFPLTPSSETTGGPSRYFRLDNHSSRVGFISPHSNNFCDSCNRVRLTAEGRLLLCLGNEHSVDLKGILRDQRGNELERLQQAIHTAMTIKPQRHEFRPDDEPEILRFMNMTGG